MYDNKNNSVTHKLKSLLISNLTELSTIVNTINSIRVAFKKYTVIMQF